MLKHYDQRENKVLKASSQKWRQEELNSRVLRHEQEAALVLRGLVLSSNQEKSPEQQGVMAAAQNHHVPAGSYTMLHSTTDPTQSYRAAQRIQAASWDAFLDQCTSRTGTFMSWGETKDQPNILTTGQSNFCASIQVWHGFINQTSANHGASTKSGVLRQQDVETSLGCQKAAEQHQCRGIHSWNTETALRHAGTPSKHQGCTLRALPPYMDICMEKVSLMNSDLPQILLWPVGTLTQISYSIQVVASKSIQSFLEMLRTPLRVGQMSLRCLRENNCSYLQSAEWEKARTPSAQGHNTVTAKQLIHVGQRAKS